MSCTTTRLADYLQPADILRRAPLFGYFKEDVLQRFTAEARVLTLPKGNTLFIQEEPAEWFYYIASGWVRLFRDTLGGVLDRQMLYFLVLYRIFLRGMP